MNISLELQEFRVYKHLQEKELNRLLCQKTDEHFRKVYSHLPEEYIQRCSFIISGSKLHVEDDFGSYSISQDRVSFYSNDNIMGRTVLEGSFSDYKIQHAVKKDHYFSFTVHHRDYAEIHPIMFSLALSFWQGFIPLEDLDDVDDVDDFLVLKDEEKTKFVQELDFLPKRFEKQIETASKEVAAFNMENKNKELIRSQKEEAHKKLLENLSLPKTTIPSSSTTDTINTIKTLQNEMSDFKKQI